jgi:hypothetical protein
MAAEAQVDASVGAHDTDGRERQVIVDGFEERGGILKLKQLQQEEERAGYEPWNQTRAWFNSAGKSEKRAHSNYFEVRELLQAAKPPSLMSTHDKDSDYERLKARAELHYLKGDYTASIAAWIAILGQYKIGTKGKAGGLKLEALDSLARCFLHIDLERVSTEEASAVLQVRPPIRNTSNHTQTMHMHTQHA